MDHIFISHAHEDEVVARKICAVIEEWGRATWVSFRDITPGAFFNEAVKAALTKSYCVVVICSSASVCNRWVNGEVERALNRNKTVILVVIEECEIPIGWSMLQRLRWNEADAEKFKASLFRALPDTALLRLSQLLNENGHLSKVKEIIKEPSGMASDRALRTVRL